MKYENEISSHKEINDSLFLFFSDLFKENQ